MTMKWYSVVIDSRDPQAQAHWWAEALGWRIVDDTPEEASVVPPGATDEPASSYEEWMGVGPSLVFVPVPEGKTVKNRLHLDLAPHTSQDRDAEIQRLLDLGARRVDVGQGDEDELITWVVLADPEGNEFCVLSSRER